MKIAARMVLVAVGTMSLASHSLAESYYFRAKPMALAPVAPTEPEPSVPLKVLSGDLGSFDAGRAVALSLPSEGGAGAVSWEAVGKLPPGLSLDAAGRLSGTVLNIGPSSFVARASVGGETSDGTFTLNVTGVGLRLAGSNTMLAQSSTPYRLNPHSDTGVSGFTKLFEGGHSHACGLTAGGDLHCWGSSYGRDPVFVLSGVAKANLGYGNGCAIKTDASLWCWGDNGNGQIHPSAKGVHVDYRRPLRIPGSYRSVASNNNLTCTVDTAGSMACRGDIPLWAVSYGSGWSEVEVNRNGFFACATKADGSLWCWGDNGQGQVGNGTTTRVDRPVQVSSENHVSFALSAMGGCAVRSGGDMWCWGYNQDARLGLGHGNLARTPQQIGGSWKWVRAGHGHFCASGSDGSLSCWGYNNAGQVGSGSSNSILSAPVRVMTRASDVALTNESTVILP